MNISTCMSNRIRLSISMLMCLSLLSVPSLFCRGDENPLQGELTWKNGDKIPGEVVSGNNSHLRWQSNLYRDPLNLKLSYLDQVKFQSNQLWGKTRETYTVQTVDGFSLFGEITGLDDHRLRISSTRFGDVEVDRSRVATILNLQTSGSLINGEFDLDRWDANRNEKKYWKVNDRGELESLRSNVHLFMKAALPESALIEVELQWEKKLDFVFGFGVPRNSRKIETLPRLESWDDSVVLSYNDDFEIVIESCEGNLKRIKFLIHWNRNTNQLMIHDEQGKQLATANLGKPSPNIDPGIYIENKSGDLKLTSLMVRRSAAGFNATKPSIQTLDDAAINGRVVAFDGHQWTISKSDPRQGKGESPKSISAGDFCGAFLVNPPQPRSNKGTRLKFFDGMFIGGQLDSIQDDSITMKTDFSKQPVTLKLAGASHLRFDSPLATERAEKFSHRLINNAGEIQGRLERGSGDKDDVLRWRVAGADTAVPLSHGDARIVLQKKQAMVAVADQWADTLYLVNRDMIPCRIVSIDEDYVTIDSFSENKKIDQQLIKAIDFRNKAIGADVNAGDTEWVIPQASKKRIKISESKMEVSKDAEFGHPWLFSSGGFEFELAWKNNSYGVLECRTLINNSNSPEGGKKVNIMLYGQNLFVSNPGEPNPNNGMIAIKNNRARFAFKFQKGKLVVEVNGKKAYSGTVLSGSNRGRGVQFKLNDMHRQNISCTLSDFKLVFSDSGNGGLVDPERKELLLTIPRLKKRNPPKQIMCATNTDMLRGELVSMDEQFVMFRANNEIQRFPKDIVTSIVWLHADHLANDPKVVSEITAEPDAGFGEPTIESDSGASVARTETSSLSNDDEEAATSSIATSSLGRQTAQVLMQGGRRMTSTLESWSGDSLLGQSVALGHCHIPLDQIYELRFGAFASRATDVPYSDWVASLAPAPKLEAGAGGEPGSTYAFGSSSPLIGTTPQSFTAEMVSGEKYSLKSDLGKVVVLDFWATWCSPCVQALPKIQRTIAQYPPDQVAFVAVNQEEDLEKIKAFLESRELKIPVALDSGEIGRQFRVDSLPQTVIIDQDGNIAFVKVGNSSDLEKKLKSAIDLLLADDDGSKKKVF